MPKYVIMNADDFGYTQGVTRGILEAHEHGVVSSTSLMVDMPGAAEAAALARLQPALGVGLHFVATNEGGPLFDLSNAALVKEELDRQLGRCCELLGRMPTHLDSHEHLHLKQRALQPLFLALAEKHHLPLRGLGAVRFNGEFYGHRYDDQWQAHPAPELIGVENLEKILRALPDGVTELACHPAYVTPDLESSYAAEREIELATLMDPRVSATLRKLEISLINFAVLKAREIP